MESVQRRYLESLGIAQKKICDLEARGFPHDEVVDAVLSSVGALKRGTGIHRAKWSPKREITGLEPEWVSWVRTLTKKKVSDDVGDLLEHLYSASDEPLGDLLYELHVNQGIALKQIARDAEVNYEQLIYHWKKYKEKRGL